MWVRRAQSYGRQVGLWSPSRPGRQDVIAVRQAHQCAPCWEAAVAGPELRRESRIVGRRGSSGRMATRSPRRSGRRHSNRKWRSRLKRLAFRVAPQNKVNGDVVCAGVATAPGSRRGGRRIGVSTAGTSSSHQAVTMRQVSFVPGKAEYTTFICRQPKWSARRARRASASSTHVNSAVASQRVEVGADRRK